MSRPWLGLRARLRALFLRRVADCEMDEELRFHIDMETDKNLAAGMSPSEARRHAYAAFGGVERYRERLREGRTSPGLEALAKDVGHAARSMRRAPLFSAIAIGTIALGVSATTAVYSIVDAFFFTGLPVPESERLAAITESRQGRTSTGLEGMRLSWERYEAYTRGSAEVFEHLAFHSLEQVALRLPDGTVPALATLTSGNYFATLRSVPSTGRGYDANDAEEVVIGDRLRRQHFPTAEAALGQLLHVDGHPMTIVGVVPPEFVGSVPLARSDLWLPYRAAKTPEGEAWYTRWGGLFGRLASGVDERTAEAVVTTLAVTIPPDNPQTTVRGADLDPLVGMPRLNDAAVVAAFVGMLLAMAMLLLLIASSNLAGMLLARSVTRRRELAIRLALGAGARRVTRYLLMEGMVLFAFGGVAGVGLAYWLIGVLASVPLPAQMADLLLEPSPDGSVLTFALIVTGLTGLVFSLAPALQASKPDVVPALRDGGRTGAARSAKLRRAFVTGQVAMASLLLVVATLLGRSFMAGLDTDLGFEPEGVMLATTDVAMVGVERETGEGFYRVLLERTRALPGVESAALAQTILLNGESNVTPVQAETPAGAEERQSRSSLNTVTPGFFETLGLEIVDGRAFTDSDAVGAPRVTIVNETLAARLWPNRSAVGQRLVRSEEAFEVVGVVRDSKYEFVMEGPVAYSFYPLAQEPRSQMTLHARAPSDGAAVLQNVRDIVRELDPNVAIQNEGPMESLIGFSLFAHRFAATTTGAFGGVGLLLALFGVYGVLSFQVAQRTREFGVRRALGARSGDLVAQVLRSGLILAGSGCVIGVLLGGGVGTLVQAALIGVEPLDPVTFAVVPAVLLLVAVAASVVPGLRAVSIGPAEALRDE